MSNTISNNNFTSLLFWFQNQNDPIPTCCLKFANIPKDSILFQIVAAHKIVEWYKRIKLLRKLLLVIEVMNAEQMKK
jgi:hypothetical protein